METSCPPKSHKKSPTPRKKHNNDNERDHDQGCGSRPKKHNNDNERDHDQGCGSRPKRHNNDNERDHDQGCGTWKMDFPENGITMEDCEESQERREDRNFNPEWQGEPRPDAYEEEEEVAETSPCTDTSNELGTDTESTPESTACSGQTGSSGPLVKSGSSGPANQSDISAMTETSSHLRIDIEKFMVQKKKIIQQIKSEDPELFQEFCKCETNEKPWYCKCAAENNKPSAKQRSPRSSQQEPASRVKVPPNAVPRRPSKQEIKQRSGKFATEGCDKVGVQDPQKGKAPHNSSPHLQMPPTSARSQQPQNQRPKPKKSTTCTPPPNVPSKPQVNRCKPPAKQDACSQPARPKPRSPTQLPFHESAPANMHAPGPSAPSTPNASTKKSKPCIPKTSAPKITGDQKKDVEAKQTFAKIKKIELDTVLDRNVHDLSLDTPDRDPTLIAGLMNSNIQIDDDPTETYAALVHPLGKNKLSATDVHHTDPGSMVPKQIPVGNLNQLSVEVLDELEAIFKSQGIAYPPDDIATAETRGLDVTQREPEKPKIKPLPAPSLFKCTLELQPLRVENFFQLRGTNSPAWYPGMMASFPDGRSDLRLIRSPSGLIKTAYTFCKP